MPQRSFSDCLDSEKPLLLPVAHDALSARLIERAGFSALTVGGFAMLGARHAIPDIGLAGLAEMVSGMRDIIEATDLPTLIDADDGYGDVKSVARTVRAYEKMGASALLLEDQRSPKRCGHMSGKEVIPAADMVCKIKAAVIERNNPDTFIMARTDAGAVEGLNAALRRAELYLEAGADGLFIEAPKTVEELELVGREFDVPQLANMLEDGRTPLMSPSDLRELGFAMVAYPTTLIFRIVRTMEKALDDLKAERLTLEGEGVGFEAFKDVVGFPRWADIEEKYSP